MEAATHLMTTTEFNKSQKISESQLIVDAFTGACLNLDVSLFEPFVEEEKIFAGKEKYRFLAELHSLFGEIRRKASNDFTVEVKDTTCQGCTKGKQAKHFIVNACHLRDEAGQFAFIIDMQDGILIDIYRCLNYERCRKITATTVTIGSVEVPLKFSYDLVMRDRRAAK